MTEREIFEAVEKIRLEKPSDIIIREIRKLVSDGKIKPGEKLPPERYLAEKFGVGRGHVREAIKKLEFFGIVKTYPQSGTTVSDLGVNLIETMIFNILELEKDDFKNLIETRTILEINAAKMAAERASESQKQDLKDIHLKFSKQVMKYETGMNEDLMFHLKIAELSGNSVLHSMIMLITPQVKHLSGSLDTCRDERYMDALSEHEKILQAILESDVEKAEKTMAYHMQKTIEQNNPKHIKT